jgi:hypothetical protein
VLPCGDVLRRVSGHLFEGMITFVGVAGGTAAEQGLLASALAASGLGWHVFPCAPGAKRPALRENWQDLATTSPDRIRAWWARQDYNIGIACGPSGLVVIDLDMAAAADGHQRPDGPSPGTAGPSSGTAGCSSGTAALESLCRAHGQPYPGATYTVDTPSGGCHLYFTAPAQAVRNSAGRLGPLIDIRAGGGYVVGAGSRAGGRAYAARGDFLPLTLPFPGWLARLLTIAPPAPETRPPPLPGGAPGHAYALAALREEARRVAAARPGTRNDTLNRAAFCLGQLAAAGLLPPLPVMTSLAGAAAHAGLPPDEARRTIRSGMAAGAGKPRAPSLEDARQPPVPLSRRPRLGRREIGYQAHRNHWHLFPVR